MRLALATLVLLTACRTPNGGTGLKATDGDDQGASATIALSIEDPRFAKVDEATVDVGNGSSFDAKIAAVESAKTSIEVQYFLFGEDFAASRMAEALIERAKAGVKVRIIVDAKTTMTTLPFFKTLVKAGGGNLQVGYFRPFPQDVIDDLKALGFGDFRAFAEIIATGDPASLNKLVAGNALLKKEGPIGTAFRKFFDEMASADLNEARFEALLANLKEAVPQGTFSGQSWFDLTKWNHHKLLLVDGLYLQGGGRNMEDAYHWEKDDQLRVDHNIKKYIFMDADFFVRDARIAKRALETFDKYWECTASTSCSAGIAHALETPADDATAKTVMAEIQKRAAEFKSTRGYARTYEPIHAGRLVAKDASVAYVENRMFPGGGTGSKLLREEPSEQALLFVKKVDELKSGEEITLHNAYLFLPARIQEAIQRALSRGVRLVIQSNSPASSDLGYIAKGARIQYENLFKIAQPGQVEIYEYMTEESLHAKVWIAGDYLFVGSINADPRCELLDTGNSLVIGPSASGPSMASQYRAWLTKLRAELVTDKKRARAPEYTALRSVTPEMVAQEREAYWTSLEQLPEPKRALRKKLRKMIEEDAATSFRLDAEGEKARKKLQAIHLQF